MTFVPEVMADDCPEYYRPREPDKLLSSCCWTDHRFGCPVYVVEKRYPELFKAWKPYLDWVHDVCMAVNLVKSEMGYEDHGTGNVSIN